ncbi:hypothetical protein [Devosia sp.]|uniref:hypothetical protein n=1 Tax=Devosia sp. TaxID=1871048 RepID=UPI001B162BEE|nr:hypothetical protein [Devosia sp.]MBO9588929.1 hypothetical protein [Devosia sp.]
MPKSMRHIGREVGAAIAVLALYMLVLLAPLHQSAGLQRELARLGFESSVSWSVCTSVANPERGDSDTPTAAKCPLTGVGKSQFVAVLPPVVQPPVVRDADPVHFEATAHSGPARPMEHPGQPRGPPQTA